MKYYLNQLAIEVTRRCNMSCAHCLRGEAQNCDIKFAYIDKLLEAVTEIGSITFTGGEPSLNVEAIEYTLKRCQELNISVYNFYVVTNGKANTLPLALACLKWYAYCDDDDEVSGLALSQDMFHDEVDDGNVAILRGLRFFRENDKRTDFNKVTLINEGRAQDLSGFRKIAESYRYSEFSYENWDNYIYVESMVYLSANGDIKTDCDIAYENSDYTIGNLDDSTMAQILASQIDELETDIAEMQGA